jgi:hypothetical protein
MGEHHMSMVIITPRPHANLAQPTMPADPPEMVKERESNLNRYPHLDDDVTGDPKLLQRLGNVGADLGTKLYVRDGRRTPQQQHFLFQQHQRHPGIAVFAMPGTSMHERGAAVDVFLGARHASIGSDQRAVAALTKEGLALPQAKFGEDWHVELAAPNSVHHGATGRRHAV